MNSTAASTTSAVRRNPLVKQFVLENDRPSKISHLNFGMLSATDMMRMSEVPIHSKYTHDVATIYLLPT
ncbi:hypothetical protein DYB37_005704 [Aphanomyces astaci]|uniref:Uncharacterized protein n=1 Tax=Aphanomyces astaci TaxID=112090 RepID=A0A3R7B2C5_APHAT|nr:hypothetical protein DYB35_001884 [Aphanomyces astaci]RHZ25523.1 hypothetical protein DYB37_005704 [Aphanomyces astaci]